MIKYIINILAAIFIAINTVCAASEADFNKIVREYTLNPDGSSEFHYYKELKLNTHIAMNNLYGETFIVYNPNYQTLKFNKAYTRQANGNIIPMPANAYNEVLPSFAADAPAYNHLKEMVVTHTGLELGATIYLDYTLYTKPGYVNELDIDDVLQELSPVKICELIINIPDNQTLNYALTGINAKPKISQNGKSKQYKWTLSNLPPAAQDLWKSENTIPRFTATTYNTQIDALKTLSKNIQTIVDENGVVFTKKLVKGEKTDTDRILKIQNYVVNQISTCAVPLEFTGYKMRAPYNVLTSAYGTKAEKLRVMVAMLKAIDINPEIVIIYRGTLNKNIKGLKPVTDMKVKVMLAGRPAFLSVDSKHSKSIASRGDRDEVWLITDQKIAPLYITSGIEEVDYYLGMKIEKNKITQTGHFTISNDLIPVDNDKNTEKYLKSQLSQEQKVYKSQLIPGNDNKTTLNFTAEQIPEVNNNYIIYQLPENHAGTESWGMQILNSSRSSSLELPYPIKENYKYEIEISPELALKTKSKHISYQAPIGKVSVNIELIDQKYIKVDKSLELNKAIISPAEYNDFRKLMQIWVNPANKTLLFSVK